MVYVEVTGVCIRIAKATTYTLNGSLGSEVRVILKVTFDLKKYNIREFNTQNVTQKSIELTWNTFKVFPTYMFIELPIEL